MKIYLDASFLVSLYSADRNSSTAASILQATEGLLIVSQLADLEVANAFELRVFRKEITEEQAMTSWDNLIWDLDEDVYKVRAIPKKFFMRAMQISKQTTAELGTRSADLLHVSAALELGCEWLYSFDERQRRLAQTMKLKVNSQT